MDQKRLKKLQSELKVIIQYLDITNVGLVDELLQTLSHCIISITEKRDNTQHVSRHLETQFSAAARPDTSEELEREPSSDPEGDVVTHSFYQTRHTISRLVAPIVSSLPTPEGPSADESPSQRSAQEVASQLVQDITVALNSPLSKEAVHNSDSPLTPEILEAAHFLEQTSVPEREHSVYSIAELAMNSPPKTESLIANWDDAADFEHLSARIAKTTKIDKTVQDKRAEKDAIPLNAMIRDVFPANSDAVILDAQDERALESRQTSSEYESPQSSLFVEHIHEERNFESRQDVTVQGFPQSSVLPGHSPCGFPFKSGATSVEEISQAARRELIDIGSYSEFPMRLTTAAEVDEMLSYFLPEGKLGTQPLMCILSLFGWNSTTLLVKVQSIDKLGNRKWGVLPHHTQLVIPYNTSDHWILVRVDLRTHQVSSYNSCGEHELTKFCHFIKDKLAKDWPQAFGDSVWEHKNESTLQQEGGSDCGFHLLENARRLSEGESLTDEPVNIPRLRVFYAEMLLARSRYEKSERVAMEGLLEAAPSTNIKARITGKRKRGLEDFEVESEDDCQPTTVNDLQALLPGVSKELIAKYQNAFQQCVLQTSTQSTLSMKRANQLICMTPSPTDKQHERLYKLGLGSERLGLINTITQRVVRAQCALDINDAREKINEERGKFSQDIEKESEETALQQAITMVALKYCPNSSRAEDVVKTIRRWRTDSIFWSMLWGYCSTFAVLLLIPHQIRFGRDSISGTTYRNIPKNARDIFFKALTELNPSIWSYVPNLGNLYAALVNRERLHKFKFKIESIDDNVIAAAPPGSDILIEAFDLCEISPAPNID